jgi:hypothetical protein
MKPIYEPKGAMTEVEKTIKDLRNVAEREKDKFHPTFAIRVDLMAADCADALDRLAKENAELREAITGAWLQLHTATFSTNKGAAELAKFIIAYLPDPPQKG